MNLLPNMSVADNLFIGREPRRFGLLRRKEMEARATALMASYGFSLDVREPLNRFSVAMQQIVAICRAIDLSAQGADSRRAHRQPRYPGGGDAVHPDAPAQG
ncbi:sugar ABC transport system [Klebsiella pneumoniae]|uniref:Sugar ABC transport system n=1 Tax=Klebsiella pneumoniae TaxID=573 RepID=A0A377ZPC8_KLEPN|nr:sugar ABC transport system [Klebsiella pneumoniae]